MIRAVRVGVFAALLLCAPFVYADQLTPEERAQLEQQLSDVEAQIASNKAELAQKQTQRQSLERDVAILDDEIKAAKLAIKQRDLTIKKLNDGIADKQSAINILDGKVAKGQVSVAQMLQRTREIDDITLVELTLGGSLSDLFEEVDQFQIVQGALEDAFKTMAVARDDLSERKSALLDQQSEETDLKQIQVLQQKSLRQTEQDKKDLVAAAKGQESVYQQVIAAQTKTAT